MINVVTISSKGQIVIPKKVREEAGLDEQDKLLVVNDEDQIILKKISNEKAKGKLLGLLETISKKIEEKNLTEKDIKDEIKVVRDEKAKNRTRY